MSDLPALVASDCHLGASSETAERNFLEFLRRAPDLGSELVLAGDLFDFWFEYRTVILRDHFQVLRCLADLVDSGLRVRLVGGNHDAWVGAFLTGEVGLEYVEGPTVTDVGGRRTYLAHGDGLAGGDWGYRALKAVLRSRPAREAFRWIHPDAATALVRLVSRTDPEEPDEDEGQRAEALARHASELLLEDPGLELVVFGHSHRPELLEVEPNRYYLNPGDWIRRFTYGTVTRDAVELRRWDRG